MKKPCLLALALVTLGFWGCGLKQLPHPHWVSQPTSALVEVPYPPPPARVEYIPKQPADAALWIDGEWGWNGRRWAWRVGRWVLAPVDPLMPFHLPASYSPWVSVRSGDGTLYIAAGMWRDIRGGEITEPAPLALGTANETDSSSLDAGRGGGGARRRTPVLDEQSDAGGPLP